MKTYEAYNANGLGGHHEHRPPVQIEHDVGRIRAEISETLEAIQRKFTPNELVSQIYAQVRGGGRGSADFLANLGTTVRDNPLPALVAGVGLAWLISSSGKPQASGSGSGKAREVAGRVKEGLGHTKERIAGLLASDGEANDYEGKGDTDRGGTPAAYAGMGEGPDAAAIEASGDPGGERLGHAAERGRQTLHHAAAVGRERLHHAAESGRETLHRSADRVRAAGTELRDRARSGAHRAREIASDTVEEQPLVLGALGIAAGVLLGAMLPRSQKEDELYGETGERIKRRIKQASREGLGKAEQTMKTIGSAVSEKLSEAQATIAEPGQSEARATTTSHGGSEGGYQGGLEAAEGETAEGPALGAAFRAPAGAMAVPSSRGDAEHGEPLASGANVDLAAEEEEPARRRSPRDTQPYAMSEMSWSAEETGPKDLTASAESGAPRFSEGATPPPGYPEDPAVDPSGRPVKRGR